jgi:hypothetical protein
MTSFEPEAYGNLVSGMDFHKFYFDTGRNVFISSIDLPPRVIAREPVCSTTID